MKAALRSYRLNSSDDGYVLLMAAILLIVLLTFGGLAIDLGWAFVNHRQLQVGADMAAVAGARARIEVPPWTITQIKDLTTAVANQNRITTPELNNGAFVETGNWNNGVFTVENANVDNVNAVRVRATRTQPTFLAMIFGQSELEPGVTSIAKIDNPTSAACLVPFGIVETFMTDKTFGTEFTLTNLQSGNWGKVQLSDDAILGSNEFQQYFASGVCEVELNIGDPIPFTEGDAGVCTAFRDAIGEIKYFPVIADPATQAGAGGGGKGKGGINQIEVPIIEFVAAEILRVRPAQGCGANWEADLVIVPNPFGNGMGGGTNSLDVVLVQ